MVDLNVKGTDSCRKISWSEFEDACNILSAELKEFCPDWIMGISRGGLPLAVALSHRTGCRNVGVAIATKGEKVISQQHASSFYTISGLVTPENQPKRILIVDDFVGIGDVFSLVRGNLTDSVGKDVQIRFASIFAIPEKIAQGEYHDILRSLSYVFSSTNDNVMFPWEV